MPVVNVYRSKFTVKKEVCWHINYINYIFGEYFDHEVHLLRFAVSVEVR